MEFAEDGTTQVNILQNNEPDKTQFNLIGHTVVDIDNEHKA